MRKILVGALGSLLLALPTLSSAVPMTWTYTGSCDWGDCGAFPSITGTLTGDPTLDGDGGDFSQWFLDGDLTSYSFTVGSETFSGNSAVGQYLLDPLGNIVGGMMLFANLELSFGVDLASTWWGFAGEQEAACPKWKRGHSGKCTNDVWGIGSGSYSVTTPTTPVPEPGTLALFGLGVLATGFAARRRRIK